MTSVDIDLENVLAEVKYAGNNIRSPFVPVHHEAMDCADMCANVMGCKATVFLPRFTLEFCRPCPNGPFYPKAM